MTNFIAVFEQGDKVIVADKQKLTEEFRKMYEKYGDGMDKDEFFYEQFFVQCLNGKMEYNKDEDSVDFEYESWEVMSAYNHIELCMEWTKNGNMSRTTLFHVLMAMNSCCVLGKREYEALNRELTDYGKPQEFDTNWEMYPYDMELIEERRRAVNV